MDEQTRRKLDEIFGVVEKRKETYGKALIGLALSRTDGNELAVFFGVVKFLEKGRAPIEDIMYDYGDFILTRKSVEVKEALDFMRSVFESKELNFNGWQEIPLRAYLSEISFIPSRRQYGYVTTSWPTLYNYGRIDDNTKGKMPNRNLSKLGLPLFPSGIEAIDELFEMGFREGWYQLDSRIIFLIPDYRARITNLRLAGNKATVEVETKQTTQTNIRAKFYVETEKRSYTSDDLHLEDGRASYITEGDPILVVTHILSAEDGESIDQRNFDYRVPLQEGITIENIEPQLLDMIEKGENMNVEFKRELSRDEFLETVVAFANTNGGTIFLGVDNNSRLAGCKEDVKDRIIDLVREHCDPFIEVQVDSGVLVKGTPIALVKVPQGTNRPYTLKDRGIFIRRGGSDRQIKRTELDEIYEAKKESSLPYQ